MQEHVDLADVGDVVIRASQRWSASAIFGVMASTAFARLGMSTGGVILAALALAPVMVVQRMRLAADRTGVTVVNLGRRQRVAWSEISDFRIGRVGLSMCLDVWRRDGTRVHAWVVTDGLSGYAANRIDAFVRELRQSLAIYGADESAQAATDRALESALVEADDGRHAALSTLVAEGRVDAEITARLLLERHRRTPD